MSDVKLSTFDVAGTQVAWRGFEPSGPISSLRLELGESLELRGNALPGLVWIRRGATRIETCSYEYLLGPTQVMWLGAGLKHQVNVLQPLELAELNIVPLRSTPATANRQSDILCTSPLLRALIDALDSEPIPLPSAILPLRTQWIISIIADEAVRARSNQWRIKLPSDARLIEICEAVRAKPENLRSVDKFALHSGLRRRNRSRIFSQDLGMTWKDWSHSVVMSHASALLLAGLPVGGVAALCGYSLSAFSFMFKASQGIAPLAFSRMTRSHNSQR